MMNDPRNRKRNGLASILLAAGIAALAAGAAADERPAGEPRPRAAERGPMWKIAGRRAYLGVSLLELTPELRQHFGAPKTSGVLVSEVSADSPAARAGVAVGDVIVGVDGEAVESFMDLSELVGDKKKGDKVELEVFRDGKSRKMSATVEERNAESLLGPRMSKKMFIRGGDGPDRTIVLDGETLPPEPFERMEQYFKSPEWKERLGNLDDCERVRSRLEKVEERLRALEQKLPGK